MERRMLHLVVALGAVLTGATMVSGEVVLFEDHFDGGTMSPQWVHIRPAQWVESDWLHTKSDGSALGRDSAAFVH